MEELLTKLRQLLDKNLSVAQVAETLGVQRYEVYGLVHELIERGYLYDIVDGDIIKLRTPRRSNDVYEVANAAHKLQLLLISDTHLTSKYDRLDILRYLYHKADERGVAHVLHSGDFTDGRSHRPEQVYELREPSYEGQIDYCVQNYPTFNGRTYFISGNHDDWWYKSAGSDICKSIARQRDDLIYLGPDVADLKIGKLRIRLFHGKGGQAYAKSYKVQKYLDAIPLAERPHILQTGHTHNAFYLKQDGTHCFQTGCLEDQTPFARSLGLGNDKSCWWVTVETDRFGNPITITPELECFGEKKKRR